MKKSIGFGIENKEVSKTDDKNCPHFGKVSIRGKLFEGKVISTKMFRSAKVEWEILRKSTKYNRYLKKKSSVIAHNSDSVKAEVGDKVLIAETRPISKTKHFTILKILKRANQNDLVEVSKK